MPEPVTGPPPDQGWLGWPSHSQLLVNHDRPRARSNATVASYRNARLLPHDEPVDSSLRIEFEKEIRRLRSKLVLLNDEQELVHQEQLLDTMGHHIHRILGV